MVSSNPGAVHWENTFEAGTDCVGFAQRAASYSGKNHLWYDLPEGIMDARVTNYRYILELYNINNQKRYYPTSTVEEQNILVAIELAEDQNCGANVGWYPLQSWDIIAKIATTPVTDDHLYALRRVVPGDIWVKDTTSSPDSNGDAKRDHIAIVAYVPPNASDLTATELMNQIILIEGEFTNKIQSVIKKLSVGDYNENKVVGPIAFYISFGLKKDVELGLNCESRAIRRLK